MNTSKKENRKQMFNFIYSHIQEVGMDRNDLAGVICSEYKDLNIAKCAIRQMRTGSAVLPVKCYQLLNVYLNRVKNHPIPLTYSQIRLKFNSIPHNGKDKTQHIGLRVSERDHKKIKGYCRDTGITISSFMDNLIQNWKETN